MRPKKTKLSLGKRCRKTMQNYFRNTKFNISTYPWTRTDDEIFKTVSYPASSTKCYSPRTPSLKTFRKTFPASPFQIKTPKGKPVMKRMVSSTKSVDLKTPSKSPSAKKVRRSLYAEDEDKHKVASEVNDLPTCIVETVNKLSAKAPGVNNTTSEVNTAVHDVQNNKTDIDETIEEFIKLVPCVMETLSQSGLHKHMLNFFKLVNESKFPLENIALQLWIEVVLWFKCDNTSDMRYSENTKKFWKLGYRLFGGQFLHFMSGYKNRSTVVTEATEKGIYPPCQSEINFAVPTKDVLNSFSPYHLNENQVNRSGRLPGILSDMVKTLAAAELNKSFCLTFDGKKLKRGLTKTSGDVDLLGFEPNKTLLERHLELEERIKPIEHMLQVFREKDELQNIGTDLDEFEKSGIYDILIEQMKTVSQNILDARELRKKKEYAKSRLIERSGGSDWKNGKYVQGISALIAFVYDIDEYIRHSVSLLDELVKCICCIKTTSKVVDQSTLNLYTCANYGAINTSDNNSSRQVKQRSSEWFEQRSKAKVTGSTVYAALGLDGLARQKDHFDVFVGRLPEKERSEKVQNAMAHGTENEVNAAATMLGKVLPMFCLNEKLYEEGYVCIKSKDNESFMVVSPDGSIRTTDKLESTTMAIEYKCPVYDVQKNFPERYLLQCLSEIEALNVDSLLYLSWRPDISTVFKVNKNEPLFNEAFSLAENIYGIEKPKRPTKITDETKSLKEKVRMACKSTQTVEFIGVVPSIKHCESATNIYDSCKFLVRRFEQMLRELVAIHEKFHGLQRQPATEAVVFLCCDLDRKWEKDMAHSVPVCWFPKGGSLDTDTMRKIFESVLNECKRAGLHVPAASFDGQWHNIAVRDSKNIPLTVMQLQKDVWKRVEQMTKREQLKQISLVNKNADKIIEKSVKDNFVSLVCTNGGKVVPKISNSVATRRMKNRGKICNDSSINDTEIDDTSDQEHRNRPADDTNNGRVSETSTVHKDTASNKEYVTLDRSDFVAIITQFKLDKQVNAKGKWNDKRPEDVEKCLQSRNGIEKLLDIEIRILSRYLKRTRKVNIKESERKTLKIERLCKILNLGTCSCPVDVSARTGKQKTKKPKSLAEMALKQVSTSLKKADLNIIYAEFLWPTEYRKWIEYQKCKTATIGLDNHYYYPSFSELRNQLEVCCVDSSHLLTRMRRKSAKGGLDGLRNNAWRAVAKSKKTALSIGMVDCILEPMSVSVANTHFSEAVEREMRQLGYREEAELCNDVRMWWCAEDEPGIPAKQRMQLRSALQQRLLSRVDFSVFPPPGMYINGWPAQLWEAIAASIDAKRFLYSLTPTNKYNVRAFSSMMGETFFSELTLYDRRGQGTVTSQEFGQFIDTTIEKLHMRMDPKRKFSYTTSRKTVYNLVNEYCSSDLQPVEKFSSTGQTIGNGSGNVRDHDFDNVGRRRVKAKAKEAKMEHNRNAVERGSLGVRWETARRNESKLLPTYRLGLDLDDI